MSLFKYHPIVYLNRTAYFAIDISSYLKEY